MSVGIENLRRALREELDVHSAFTWEKFLREGVDAHFNARLIEADGERAVRPSEYWVQEELRSGGGGYVKVPKGVGGIAIYSKRAFRYPTLVVYAKLPRLALAGDEYDLRLYIGLEDGSAGSLAAFRLITTTTVDNRLDAIAGRWSVLWRYVPIDANKPEDFDTAKHVYSVSARRNMIMFSIDGRPVHFALTPHGGVNAPVKSNVKPYSITINQPLPAALTTLIELHARPVANEDKVAPIAPFDFRVAEGHEVEPLALPLYIEDTDTKLAGYTVESGSATSHPFPIFGYARKSIYFMADQAGTLSIEVYTTAGNWREYDSVSVTANSLAVYNMVGEALLARVAFTPDAYPAKVLEAEVILT